MKRLFIALLVLLALAAGYFLVFWNWSYATGDRAGWVQKLSYKGWLCKTWEGELAMVAMPGTIAEKFYFTVHDEAVAEALRGAIGSRVDLHYEQKVGLPTSCFGDTRYFVTGFSRSSEGVYAPGLNSPAPAQAPAASQAASQP
ncbi:hypothetical protein [Ideonella sp.]|uniref:hypothetical protein n=1 Tax=Ideonella sp. TaxID=1929293 RepID=UPI003BB7F9B2